VHAFIKKPFSLTLLLEQLMPYVEKYHERISQIRDSARTGEALENPDQAQTADHNIDGSRLSKAKLAINLMSCLSPDSK